MSFDIDNDGWHSALTLVALVIVGVALMLALTGCGGWTPAGVTPTDPKEVHFVSEVDRLAAKLGVDVRGVVTAEEYWLSSETCATAGITPPCLAGGWYDKGVAYAYQPTLLKRDLAWGTAIACHETCHSKFALHGAEHDACMIGLCGKKS